MEFEGRLEKQRGVASSRLAVTCFMRRRLCAESGICATCAYKSAIAFSVSNPAAASRDACRSANPTLVTITSSSDSADADDFGGCNSDNGLFE